MTVEEGIRDLSSLRRLTRLTGLIVSQFSGNLEAMGEFKSLEFLGLTADTFDNDPDKIARIRAALPRPLVAPASPLCLGSGWILLVMPLAALMWIAGSWARRRRRTSPQYGSICGGGKQR